MNHLKIRISMYFIGLFVMTIGIALSVKSNLGVSPVSSIPYTMTCVWGIEMGKATILFHCFLVLLQILLLPFYIFLFFGGSVSMSARDVLSSILIVLLIPFLISFGTKLLGKSSAKWKSREEWLKEAGDNGQLLFLCLAVIFMFASESQEVFAHPILLLEMLIPLAIFFVVNFLVVRFIGKKENLPTKDIISLNFTTLARNSPLSLAIAVAAFPNQPLISLALVIGPLIELPALGIISGIIKKLK